MPHTALQKTNYYYRLFSITMASSSENSKSEDLFMTPPSSYCDYDEKPRTDTEESVAQQTDDVVRSFFVQRSQQEQIQTEFLKNPEDSVNLSPAAEVGQMLAKIGDDVFHRYSHIFDAMIQKLDINQLSAYDKFAEVTKQLFDNDMNWGRILILLCFGYKVFVTILNSKTSRYFSVLIRQIVSYLVKFIIHEKIAKWIAEHGGWKAAVSFLLRQSTKAWFTVTTMATVSVIAVIFFHKYS